MLNLYTETAFQATPPTVTSSLDFQIPRRNGSYDKSKFSNKSDRPQLQDEETFSQYNLASATEIYFRQTKSYPRSFLWRVVADKLLQIQCADLTKSAGDSREADLTLKFSFQDAILPAGVTLADSENENELHIFVGTVRNELFHLQIPINAFRNPNAISQNVGQWCSPVDISSLSIETVFRIYASTPYELFVSYISGKLQRLQRKANDQSWVPENYDDSTWGASLRSIVGRGRQQQINYNGMQLDPRVVHGMVASSDSNYLFTTCLNHQLRVWHLASGRLVVTRDLLDLAREQNDRVQLNPAESGYLQLFKLPLNKNPILVTYSPCEGGQFKFWDVKGGLTEPLSVDDRYPTTKLSPPDPDPSGNTVWSMTSFRLSPGNDSRPPQIWVLWRNHNYHQLYTTRFEFGNMDRTWNGNWVQCSSDTIKKPSGPDFVRSDARDVTSKWLDFLFRPSLYTTAVLETALFIYAKSTSATLPSQSVKNLKQRLTSVVAASTSLRKYDDSEMDYDRFATDTDRQWRNYWNIVESINDARRAPIALSYDLFSEMTWILMADMCCAVRECSPVELILRNELDELASLEEIAGARWPHRKVDTGNGPSFQDMTRLVIAARTFRKSFTAELVINLAEAIEEEILVDAELVTSTRIYEMYESVNFGDAISNDTFHKLEKNLEHFGALNELKNELFTAIINLVSSGSTGKPPSQLRSTTFALQLVASGLLDIIVSTRQLLRDLMVLVIFIEGEINQEDEKMIDFDGGELLSSMDPLLKTQERNFWLATHSRLVSHQASGREATTKDKTSDKKLNLESGRTVSLLEDILSKVVQPQPVVEKPQMYHITDMLLEIQDWCYGRNQIAIDEASVYLQCNLLRHNEVDYATEFLRFQPATAWSSYIKGRLYLAKRDFNTAAQYFTKAAYGLACGKAVGELQSLSSSLLSRIEVESFNNGMPRYFYHILTLFESAKAYTHTAYFARLSLQSSTPGQKDHKSTFHTEILSRLFTAELKTSRYREAFQALSQTPDPAIQKSNTTSLIKAILDPQTSITSTSDMIHTIQTLPWTLQPQLAKHLDTYFSTLAKAQKTIPVYSSSSTTNKTPDYLQILHAIRVSQKNYRGAVSVLFDRLRLIQRSSKARSDPQATALRHALLTLINAMSCVSEDEAYILVEVPDEPSPTATTNTATHQTSQNGMSTSKSTRNEAEGDGDIDMDQATPTPSVTEPKVNGKKSRRIIITLDDLRKEYQAVLDKCSRIERGDFAFDVNGEDDDDDEDEDDDGDGRNEADGRNGIYQNGRETDVADLSRLGGSVGARTSSRLGASRDRDMIDL